MAMRTANVKRQTKETDIDLDAYNTDAPPLREPELLSLIHI